MRSPSSDADRGHPTPAQAFNTADVDTLIAASDSEIRIKPLRVLPRAEYVGHDGIRALLSDLAAGPIADVVVTIFERIGVRSRRDLVGKVFFSHYEPRLRDDESRATQDKPLRGGPMALR